jgi:hypothetical protein
VVGAFGAVVVGAVVVGVFVIAKIALWHVACAALCRTTRTVRLGGTTPPLTNVFSLHQHTGRSDWVGMYLTPTNFSSI